MSGKPATPVAAGAPRLLLYVESQDSAPPYLHDQHLHRNTLYKPPDSDIRNTVYYKPEIDKLCVYGENTQRQEFYPVQRSYCKEPLKDDSKVNDRHDHVIVKREDANPLNVDYTAVPHSFHGRIPVETELYQRCPVGPESSVSSMQSVLLQHGRNQLSDGVHSESNCSDKELSVDKSVVNYQFLEQSVTHQSIVNQSISILNQQVGVSRSEGDSGTAQQLVRTADGVVLAVLPSTVPHNGPEPPELSSRTLQSDSQTITVPLGWRRIVSGSSVIYVSPSGTALSTLPQLREYLQTTGTCKCGLPCPLRPETTFSFDPKVVSKPYQAPTGAELTKLCNHKRKLLATLSARAQSPGTPPPPPYQLHHEQKKVLGTEFAVVKKKMKKRQNYPNMTVSQLMVQRDRSANEFKVQDMDPCRTVSPGLNTQRGKSQPCLPYNTLQNIPSSIQDELKTEAPVPRSSHYLTVNSGWIQQESIDQKNCSTSANSSLNVGMPVLGTNGQIIGVNTSYNNKNIFKNAPGVTQQDLDIKEEKKEPQYVKKEEESQVFSLNQLTPDVMQKINEQQQLFIQQNQKQIEMAMKGYRTQLENTNKPCQNQYMPPGQLVIQNGAVVKTNPAKTPPWQVKRNDSMTSPSPKSQKSDNMDFEESNTNLSEESTNSNSSFHSEHMNQAMCSRVPPLPQQYSMMGQQWPNMDLNKKKPKTTKGSKKKASPTENKSMVFGNNGMRIMQDIKGKCDDLPHNNIPSFMEDPNGYLAQQTALLNNTISRQVGINSTYDSNQFDGSNNYNPHMQVEKPKPIMKHADMQNIYRSNIASNPSPSPNTPDSSVISDKNIENSLPQCCKGCNVNTKPSSEIYTENQIRRTYMKQNIYNKPEIDHSAMSSPKHGFDDNPVTSSTFIDRSPMVNDNCGPIQAATVSTSNVSPTETLQPPEPSPTPSNSSRNTDTPHSQGSSSSQLQNCSYPMKSPAYSHPGSYNSNPSTPGYLYNSPGPPNTQSISGTQMMHFISNHNVNKNLMEVDNISMVGVKPGLKQEMYRSDRKRMENSMPGYCPPPHLGGGPAHSLIQTCYVQTYVTTMASGFSVTRDTLTSVLAGKAGTSTTSINASQANFVRPSPPPSVNLATTYAIPNNHPDPFIHSVNLPTSYPLHIAGTTAQNMISKSPMEMVQNVIGSHPSKTETNNTQTTTLTQLGRRSCPTATPGQILISSTGQIIVSNSTMPPPPPKTTTTVSQIQASNSVTNVTTSITQVMPGVVNQSAVVVNNLQTPFVIQPPIMAVDGPVVQQNTVLPQIMAGGIVSGQSQNERQIDVKSGQGYLQGVSMLSPENLKKKSKKKKNHANVTNVLQIAAPQQNTNNIMVHHSSPQHNTSPQFSPRGFQLSPNNNISPPMLQALTIVPGKSGTPAHIVMNGQGNTNNFGSQQIITNTSPSQQINLLQPVNLINNASGVVSNFGGFQQFILPNLGGMVMTADGTAIIQDNGTGVPMQLQLQTVNGQNVLTPVQNQNVFTAGANGGVVIRAQNQQGKIVQSQHSPGAQFLSPNSQVMMNSPNFNGQLSPLLANLSPTNVTFNTSPHQVRSNNVQTQEFIQTNQMGQTLMVPLSPKQVSIASATSNRSNSTFVQQNTTIVQQQTTLVSNSHNNHVSSITANLQGGNTSRLSIDPNVLLNSAHKQITNQIKSRNFVEMPPENIEEIKEEKLPMLYNHNESPPQNESEVKMENPENYSKFVNDFNPILGQMQGLYGSHVRHSVSTQTLVNQQRGGKSPSNQAISGSSPPDTTTHSPLGALESTSSSPRLYGARSMSTQGNYADTTTKSPEPADANSSAMVQCVSSSEPDLAEREHSAWSNEFGSDCDTSLMSNIQLMRQTRHTHNSVESTEIHYNHNQNQMNVNQQNMLPITPSYFERQPYKRKSDFPDGSNYRNEKIMRTAYNMVHGQPKDADYDIDKTPKRHYSTSGSSSDNASLQKVFDRHNLGNDAKDTAEPTKTDIPEKTRKFNVGDLIWGPVKGYASWPGKLAERTDDGKWTVQWFGGDKALGSVEDARLLTLSEGLEAHHAARTKHRKSRKLNTHLENAIQEAMAELDKKSENITLEETHLDAGGSGITETPKRGKKEKKKEKFKKASTLVKIAPHTSKTGDGARLRSAR